MLITNDSPNTQSTLIVTVLTQSLTPRVLPFCKHNHTHANSSNLSYCHSSHYSVTPKVLPNYRMANDLPNFGNRSTEKTLILSLLSPPFFSFPVSCLFYRDSTSLGLSSLEQWYFISTTIRMVLRHYLCHNTPRFIHET